MSGGSVGAAQQREAALKVIVAWGHEAKKKGLVSDVYVFGSALGLDRERFNAKVISDIDLTLIIPADVEDDAVKRSELAVQLRRELRPLEHDLLLSLERKIIDPIVSANLITRWEAQKAIHKDGRPGVFRAPSFKEVHKIGEEPTALCHVVDDEFFSINEPLVAAIAIAQKVRNGFLRTNIHGHEFPIEQMESKVGEPIAKKLARHAAEVASFEREGRAVLTPRETDPLEGLEYLTVLLNRRNRDHQSISELRDHLAVRRGAPGFESAPDRNCLLLMSEIVFDAARLLIQQSPLERVRGVIGRFTD